MADKIYPSTYQKLLAFERMEEVLKETTPIEYFKAISILEYKTGLSRKVIEHFLVILSDMGKIKINEGKVEVVKC